MAMPSAIPLSSSKISISPSAPAYIIVHDDIDDENLQGAKEAESKPVLSYSVSSNGDLSSRNFLVTGKRREGQAAPTLGSPLDSDNRASCVAKRTRLQIGFLPRFSYTQLFEDKVLDEEEAQVVDDSNPETSYETENGNDDITATFLKRPVYGKGKKSICVDELGKEFIIESSPSDEADGEDQLGIDSSNEAKPAKKARMASKRVNASLSKDDELYKVLLDSIFNNTDEVSSLKDDSRNEDDAEVVDDYPLLFSFGDEGSTPLEKSASEEMLDELWAEFDFALQSVNVGDYGNDELPEDYYCSEGEHEFVLDEQIGIICKFCSFVRVKIKYVLPSLAKHDMESQTNKSFAIKADYSMFKDMFVEKKNNSDMSSSGIPTGTVWDHVPGVDKTLYGHQREAFEFIWKNLAGSIHLNELKVYSGSAHLGGCVISHAPGTGKSRLTIVFIQSYLKQFPDCRPLIIAPRGMLLTWENEFKKWKVNLAFHNLNLNKYYGNEGDSMVKLSKKESRTDKWIRLLKLCTWQRGRSVLAVSYTLFAKLTTGTRGNKPEGDIISRALLEQPGLIIFDEGHTPRNDQSLIWQAIEKVETVNRIILSGTPFQNNLRELSNTLCLVRPKLGCILSNIINPSQMEDNDFSRKSQNMFQGRNRGKNKWKSLGKYNLVDSSKIAELKSTIKPFVHVHNGNILDTLPGLRECLVLLNPPKQQRNVLEKLDRKLGIDVEAEYKLCMASIHPSLVICVNLSEQERSVIDVKLLQKWKLNPNDGVKTKFVIELVRLSQALNEKVLVFCQYVEPLMMLRDQLIKVFNWIDGKQILKMDGSVKSKSRHSIIDFFNDLSSEARILLASTKACSEGISLVGASRVVLLDVLWNPSVERQAISRAYRIGQVKVVYTYQLIMSGTGEREKYKKQVEKDKLSELLFSTENDIDNITSISLKAEKERTSKFISEDKILEEMTANMELKDMLIKLHFPVKKSAAMGAFREDGVPADLEGQ